MNRPVISKAAESALLMAFKVAEDLEVRIVEAIASALRTSEQTSCGDPGQLVHGTDFIDAQWAVQCCFTQRRASRFGAESTGAFVAVDPCVNFLMWLSRITGCNGVVRTLTRSARRISSKRLFVAEEC